ncbi:MAG TPA: hypothetical protein VH025_01355, partial [Solirubrobacteraceae bacterium]|nr:hypothetical protein [Solirubrobacteraceae bacterium]
GKPKCKRTVSAGSVILAGHTGSNVLRFQGRVSVHRTLAPGTYAVAISAQDSRGIRSAAQSLRFTIVAG